MAKSLTEEKIINHTDSNLAVFSAKIEVMHKGCWSTELSKKFPDIEFRLTNCQFFKDHTIGIISVKGDERRFDDIEKTLKSFSIIKKLEVIDSGKDYLYLRLHTYNERDYETITYYVLKENCFVLGSVVFCGGKEIWAVGTEKRENLSRLYSDLKKLGAVTLKSIQKSAIENTLTDRQRAIISLAKDLGYYQWPRRITVTKLAKFFSLSKSTFVEHLRKAESKIIKNS